MNQFHACPGSRMMAFRKEKESTTETNVGAIQSQLRQWPIQLHLISPEAPYYQDADVVLTADCVAYARGDFHREYLKGRALAIACPKLDTGQEIYREKMTSGVDDAKIKSLNVLIMQVPCCTGLLNLAKQALEKANEKSRCLIRLWAFRAKYWSSRLFRRISLGHTGQNSVNIIPNRKAEKDQETAGLRMFKFEPRAWHAVCRTINSFMDRRGHGQKTMG